MISRKVQIISLLVVCLIIAASAANKDDENKKPAWAKKKITDYSDADMERLLDQWNVSKQFFCIVRNLFECLSLSNWENILDL